MNAEKTDNKKLYPVMCELIEELAFSAYHQQMPPDGYKPNKKYNGAIKKKFEISGPQDVADAVISLIFGEETLLERKKRGPKGFEKQDRELIKLMWKKMEEDGLTLGEGLDYILPMAGRREPGTSSKKTDPVDNDDNVKKRIQELQQKMKKEEAKREEENAKQLEIRKAAEPLTDDMIAEIGEYGLVYKITEESMIQAELDFISNWLGKYTSS